MVTIGDVAAHAGVGVGTVSRVINDHPSVSQSTRARVLGAIEALGYRPNQLARALKRGRCHSVGVIVPFFTHASAIERLRGVVEGLDGSPYDLVLFNVTSPEHRAEHFATIDRQRADGLIVMSLPPSPQHLERLLATGMPVVLVDARAEGVPAVITDDVEGGRIASRHLVALGHRRIAFLGDSRSETFGFTASAEREQGYREVLAGAGIAADPALIRRGPHDRDAAEAIVGELLDAAEPPTAVFATSDTQALGALEAARSRGLAVPGDVSIVGYDDLEVAALAGLTTVHQPLFRSGEIGIRLLLDALAGQAVPAECHRLPLGLVSRSTAAPPRVERPMRRTS